MDQAGNVWKWCEDVWNEEAYKDRDGKEDPVSTTGEPAVRCLRGGSWNIPAGYLAAAYRVGRGAWGRHRNFGFRCSLPARPEP